DHAGLHRLPRGRQEVQITQASFAHAVQHDAGAVPREMAIGARLSDGGAELCGGSFAPRQANGARPAAAAAQIGPPSRIAKSETALHRCRLKRQPFSPAPSPDGNPLNRIGSSSSTKWKAPGRLSPGPSSLFRSLGGSIEATGR